MRQEDKLKELSEFSVPHTRVFYFRWTVFYEIPLTKEIVVNSTGSTFLRTEDRPVNTSPVTLSAMMPPHHCPADSVGKDELEKRLAQDEKASLVVRELIFLWWSISGEILIIWVPFSTENLHHWWTYATDSGG